MKFFEKKPDTERIDAIISEHMIVTGNIHMNGNVNIAGIVDGNITSDCTNENSKQYTSVVVQAGGAVTGNITANRVVVGGIVIGNIIAETVIVKSTCTKIEGDIFASTMSIEPFGGEITGKVNIKIENKPSNYGKAETTEAVETLV